MALQSGSQGILIATWWLAAVKVISPATSMLVDLDQTKNCVAAAFMRDSEPERLKNEPLGARQSSASWAVVVDGGGEGQSLGPVQALRREDTVEEARRISLGRPLSPLTSTVNAAHVETFPSQCGCMCLRGLRVLGSNYSDAQFKAHRETGGRYTLTTGIRRRAGDKPTPAPVVEPEN
ncbi:unnamed protein product [Pleuronectes platessa]|uniref:Uncharacterized protein n=1 Tax=Pleuronectes platessa TaxID=8262 RepID=A0A9N7Z083_PLEPL|nr:unnamed protein product [Pleuronectes platessa]